jgi:hypothetical protein
MDSGKSTGPRVQQAPWRAYPWRLSDVRIGTQRDAILFACGANAKQGLRRSNEDKRKAVGTLLADAEWGQWSDNAISKACCVSNHMVATMRAHLGEFQDSPPADGKRTVERGGTTYDQDTSKIGKGITPKLPSAGVGTPTGGTLGEPATPTSGNVATRLRFGVSTWRTSIHARDQFTRARCRFAAQPAPLQPVNFTSSIAPSRSRRRRIASVMWLLLSSQAF